MEMGADGSTAIHYQGYSWAEMAQKMCNCHKTQMYDCKSQKRYTLATGAAMPKVMAYSVRLPQKDTWIHDFEKCEFNLATISTPWKSSSHAKLPLQHQYGQRESKAKTVA